MPKQVRLILKALQVARQAENYSASKASGAEAWACKQCAYYLRPEAQQGAAAAAAAGELTFARCIHKSLQPTGKAAAAGEEHPKAVTFRAATCKGELYKKAP